jgi:hypothetical protein
MTQNFLIRRGDQFLLSWEGGSEPQWTGVPSLAAHFTYQDADETAQDLQETGFECAVANIFGEIATLGVIRKQQGHVVLATDPGYKETYPPLPPEITSEVIRKAPSEKIKFWIRQHGSKAVNARLAE